MSSIPYEGARLDASQGIAEVNWFLMREARRLGLGVLTVGHEVCFGDILPAAGNTQEVESPEAFRDDCPTLF